MLLLTLGAGQHDIILAIKVVAPHRHLQAALCSSGEDGGGRQV
jgi:hypothetical protein